MKDPSTAAAARAAAFLCLAAVALAPLPLGAEESDGAGDATVAGQHPAMNSLRKVVTVVQGNLRLISDNPDQRDGLTKTNIEIIDANVHWESFFKLVFGRAWKGLGESQREEIVERLRSLVVRVYSRALEGFTDHRVEYVRTQESPRPDIVAVEMRVVPPDNSPPLQIQSRMRKVDGRWLSFDFITAGVSISSAYKSNYRDALAKGGYKALMGLIDEAYAKARDKEALEGQEGAEGASAQEPDEPQGDEASPASPER